MIVLLIVAAILYVLIVNHFAAPHPEEWQHLVTAGGVVGARCERPIVPGEPWDLGHDDYDRSVYPARSIAPVTEPPPVTAGFRVGGDALSCWCSPPPGPESRCRPAAVDPALEPPDQ
jgi:hypothetical protein